VRRLVALLALAAPAAAQDNTLDLVDGETLYEGGWLVTLDASREERGRLLDGSHDVQDPSGERWTLRETTLAVHHGLRHDLQLSLLVPRVENTLERDVAPRRLAAAGLGDMSTLAKWRVLRRDAPGEALNVALLGGLQWPTGEDDARDAVERLPPDLQPGSGSLDLLLGAAATWEPRRWRYNAAALFQRAGHGDHVTRGDAWLFELAAGNRFWLEPYPGPFMRFDLLLRHRHAGRDHDGGQTLGDSGGDVTTLGANLAFRPRPSLDLQLEVEVPVAEDVHGTQLATEPRVSLALGVRF
jgi:hypothetical protein